MKAGTEIRERKDGWFEISDIKAISLTPPTVDIKLITFTIDYHDRQKSLDLISE